MSLCHRPFASSTLSSHRLRTGLMVKVLVTGATGFIGRNLVPILIARGHEATLLSRRPGDAARISAVYPELPVFDLAVLERDPTAKTIDAFVHLAGIAGVDGRAGDDAEQTIMAANAELTERLRVCAERSGASRFIFLSSVMAVSANSAETVVNDRTAPKPDTAYGRAKLAAEAHVAAFAAQDRFSVSLRAPIVIGSDAKGNWASIQKLAGSSLPMPFGALKNRRSVLSVATLCDAVVHLLECDADPQKSGHYALADLPAVTMKTMIANLREGMNRPTWLVPIPAALLNFAFKTVGMGRQAKSMTGSLEVDPHRFFETFEFHPSRSSREAIIASGRLWADARDQLRRQTPTTGRPESRLRIAADRILAALGLLLLWPFLVIIGLAIRLDSPGPALHIQLRVGQRETIFDLYKFRTMHVGTPQAASHEIDMPSVTRLGRTLRRTKLDELPQLINVLRGEMAFVGPRPCLPTQTELIEERRRLGVDSLRPGITGVAQVAGIDMSLPEQLARMDSTYLNQRGLRTDLRLILQTIAGAGRGDRVKER